MLEMFWKYKVENSRWWGDMKFMEKASMKNLVNN